jgi:hypothetical protein
VATPFSGFRPRFVAAGFFSRAVVRMLPSRRFIAAPGKTD